MGLLLNGKQTKESSITDKQGSFIRENAQIRNWITIDGRAGPTGQSGFKPATHRYHLYVSLACPWAHRTLIFRTLKKLTSVIDISIVSPDMLNHGWSFNTSEGSTGDPINNFNYIH